MADVTVELNNNNIQQYRQQLHEAILKGLEACGLEAERYAKMKCPVDTGRLRNSITHVVSGQSARTHVYTISHRSKYDSMTYRSESGRRRRATRAMKEAETRREQIPATDEKLETMWLGTNVEYAAFIECGGIQNGRHYPPKPFLVPALADHKNKYRIILKTYLTQATP